MNYHIRTHFVDGLIQQILQFWPVFAKIVNSSQNGHNHGLRLKVREQQINKSNFLIIPKFKPFKIMPYVGFASIINTKQISNISRLGHAQNISCFR